VFVLAIDLFIDRGNLPYPSAPVGVLEREHRLRLPMKVIRDEGYLLVKRLEGVA